MTQKQRLLAQIANAGWARVTNATFSLLATKGTNSIFVTFDRNDKVVFAMSNGKRVTGDVFNKLMASIV